MTVKGSAPSVHAEARVTVKNSRDDTVTFVNHVMPLLGRLGCNQSACHGSAQGKGGLRLSLFSGDAEEDYAALTRMAYGRRLNKFEPQKSLLLVKATGGLAHAGGRRIAPGSPKQDLLMTWVAQGAHRGDEQGPPPATLEISPEEQVLPRGESLHLLVRAVYADGTHKDITGTALFKSLDPQVAGVDETGKLLTKDHGQTAIVATYLGRAATVRVLVPQVLPVPFPTMAANNPVDEFVFARLRQLGIPPSDLCTDAEFVRRVFLDVIGTLPTPDEVRAFQADPDPKKRARLIDRLLERPEYTDYWALKWGDLLRIKSEYPVNVWPKAVTTYYRWLRDSIAQNKPYDQFVRELLTSSGSNFRHGPANYFRAVPNRDPQSFAETTALVFMGARLGCARCHIHPTEGWTLNDNLSLGAFFASVTFKSTSEWKEEIVYLNTKARLWHPRTRQLVKPRLPGGEVVDPDTEADLREKFAAWLTSPRNPWFARAIVNRVWFWLLGRGIVHEPDDLRQTNPPQNPELLAYLSKELLSHKYDLKHIFRVILNSRTYQLSSRTTPYNERDVANFSHYPLKRLAAEQLLDALCQATETQESFGSWIPVPSTLLPTEYKAIQIFDGDINSAFLELFGRPARDTCYEAERTTDVSLRQALHLIDSSQVVNKADNSPRLRRLLESKKTDAEIVDEIYLATLSRLPRADEKQKVLAYLGARKAVRGQAFQDLFWTMLNTKEFISNH